MKLGAEARVRQEFWVTGLGTTKRWAATMHKLILCCLIIISVSCPLLSLPIINASEMSYQHSGKSFDFHGFHAGAGAVKQESSRCAVQGALAVLPSSRKCRNAFRTPISVGAALVQWGGWVPLLLWDPGNKYALRRKRYLSFTALNVSWHLVSEQP